MLYPKENKFRQMKNLDGFWKFSADKENVGLNENWCNGIGGEIRTISVPASWNDIFNDLFNFHGKGWYERNFTISDKFKDEAVYIRCGSVARDALVWVNGQQVVSHVGGALPFEAEISKYINFEGENRLVILADSTLDAWSIPPALIHDNEARAGFHNSYPAVPYDFFPYGGIHRSVWLYTCAKERIEDVVINTEIEKDFADVNFEISVSADKGKVKVSTDSKEKVYDIIDGIVKGSIRVDNPRLWDVGQPNLYDLEMTLIVDGKEIDSYTETYGIRSIKVESDKFLLNGKPVFMNGFGKHEDFFVIGKGFCGPLVVKDFELMKWVGANSFRTSHYPYDEQILDYADRQGILVIDETPCVGFNDRIYTDEMLPKVKNVIGELIHRDKNHPSVVMWSLANEPVASTPEGKNFFKEMAETARLHDSTRPITYVGFIQPEHNLGMEYYDVICINRYCGWYEGPGQIDETLPMVSEYLDMYHNLFNKPVLYAEFGADCVAGMHSDPPQMFSEEFQAELIKKQYEVVASKDFTIGAHVWNFADFQSLQNVNRVIVNRKGVFTRDRQPKMAAHVLRSMWKKD